MSDRLEDTTFKLILSSTKGATGWPDVEVLFGDEIIYRGIIEDVLEIEKTIQVPEGLVSFRVDLLNHSYKDVVLNNEDNTEIQNKTITIDLIELEGIDVTNIAYSNGTYHVTEDGYPYHKDQPLVRKKEVSLVWNGHWQFEVECPVYIWLLENL